MDTSTNLELCYLRCYEFGTVWPKPKSLKSIDYGLVEVNNFDLQYPNYEIQHNFWVIARQRFLQLLKYKIPDRRIHKERGNGVLVRINVKQESVKLTLETDEGYNLKVNWLNGNVDVTITAETCFGARHALETLSQLIQYDDNRNLLVMLKQVEIDDAPVYKYRGVMMDTARRYYTIESIKKTIGMLVVIEKIPNILKYSLISDIMAMVKLNVLHWHLTDTESFPMQLNSHPELSEIGAYSQNQIYSAKDIASIVEFGKHRGVMIVPEFDSPAHVGEGWQFTDVLNCFQAQPWEQYCAGPPCGQFDVTKESVYQYLDEIYREINEMFDSPGLFHMGGDEVSFVCWNSSSSIKEWMVDRGWSHSEDDFVELWGYFQDRALEIWKKYSDADVILWSSSLTKNKNVNNRLDKNEYIIHYWGEPTDNEDDLIQLLEKKYRVIISRATPLYLDCGFGSWVDNGYTWCSPYNSWAQIYDFDIMHGYEAFKEQILGGEVCAWSAVIDETTIESRLWPRSSAFAERLWSDPKTDYQNANNRMIFHRFDLRF